MCKKLLQASINMYTDALICTWMHICIRYLFLRWRAEFGKVRREVWTYETVTGTKINRLPKSSSESYASEFLGLQSSYGASRGLLPPSVRGRPWDAGHRDLLRHFAIAFRSWDVFTRWREWQLQEGRWQNSFPVFEKQTLGWGVRTETIASSLVNAIMHWNSFFGYRLASLIYGLCRERHYIGC